MLNDELNTAESRHLLKIVDNMREILHHEKITLPQIVVVEDQSVGKSSVLEALSGIQLLRAQNICTRCPLELRMKNIAAGQSEFATIRCEGVEEIRMTNFSDIKSKVQHCTERLAGKQQNVSSSPIYLTVYKNAIKEDLTLIDLPGITRNPVGDQSKDIYQQIVALIKKYIEPGTAIVLHVIPSSVDFTTSESIQIAKQFDSGCERQLIAVSKIDKFDKGIEEKLRGVGPGSMVLKLGCVAVLNRNQDEIDRNISFEQMREKEEEFFRTNGAFTDVPERYLGSGQLVKRLALIQQERIRSTLPSILDELKIQIKNKKTTSERMPPAVTSEMDCWTLYIDLVTKYRRIVHARVHGTYDYELELKLGDSANSIQPLLTSATKAVPDRFDDRNAFRLYERQKACRDKLLALPSPNSAPNYRSLVLQLLEENTAVALPNFPSFSIIEQLYRPEHTKLQKPCEELIDSFNEYLKVVLIKLLHRVFAEDTSYKYQLLHKLTDIVIGIIDESVEHCRQDVKKMLEIEQRIFTFNPSYMDSVNRLKANLLTKQNEPKTSAGKSVSSEQVMNPLPFVPAVISNEHQAAQDVEIAIDAYFSLVKKRVVEQISQLCYYWFVTRCALALDSKLSTAFTSALLFEWMREPMDQQERRENLKRSINAMERALLMGQNA